MYRHLISKNKQTKKRGISLIKDMTFLNCENSSNQNDISCEEEIFQLIYMDTENQKVEVWETNHLAFDDLINHLKTNESVFISKKRIPANNPLS